MGRCGSVTRAAYRDGDTPRMAGVAPPHLRPPGRRAVAACTVLVGMVLAAPPLATGASARGQQPGGWEATWTAGLVPATDRFVAGRGALAGFTDQTFRQVVHVSAGGRTLRLRFSNAFGHVPLTIGAASVGAQGLGPAVEAVVAVSFRSGRSVTIPAGGAVTSEPVPFTVEPGTDLAVSMFFPQATGPVAWHFLALQTSYSTLPGAGDHTMDQSGAGFPVTSRAWYVLRGVDVLEPPGHATVVAFGDSITDGFGATGDGSHRWPDVLWSRLDRSGYPLAVVDAGIGKNRILSDDPTIGGPSGLSRLRRDALDQPGARTIIFLEGINDIFAGATAAAVIGAMRTIVGESHADGLAIFGGTLTPVCRTGPREARREEVNAFVRTSHVFDGVVDFAAAVEDPAAPACLQPRFDSGDHVHPDDAGYAAMAGAVDAARLDRASGAAAPAPASTSVLSPAAAALVLAACAGAPVAVLCRRRTVAGARR